MRQKLCKLLRPWISEFVIRGIIPERIGRYRILDMLLILEEKKEGGLWQNVKSLIG